ATSAVCADRRGIGRRARGGNGSAKTLGAPWCSCVRRRCVAHALSHWPGSAWRFVDSSSRFLSPCVCRDDACRFAEHVAMSAGIQTDDVGAVAEHPTRNRLLAGILILLALYACAVASVLIVPFLLALLLSLMLAPLVRLLCRWHI